MSAKREREKRAFQLILESGEEGLLQAEMWRRLGISDRDGSRIARGFEENGVIKWQRELHDGRWTYRLFDYCYVTYLKNVARFYIQIYHISNFSIIHINDAELY